MEPTVLSKVFTLPQKFSLLVNSALTLIVTKWNIALVPNSNSFHWHQARVSWGSWTASHTQLSVYWSCMWVGQAASMSLSNQGIHCCSGSGYSFTKGPHLTLLAAHCCFEQSCLLMPGSLTWISRKSFWRERERNARGGVGWGGGSSTTTICLKVSCVFSAS